MLSPAEIEYKIGQLKPILAQRFGVSKIGYFGSYALETQTEASDLDLIIEFSKPIGWGFFTLQKFLEQQLDLPVDMVTNNALKQSIKHTILNQVKYI